VADKDVETRGNKQSQTPSTSASIKYFIA